MRLVRPRLNQGVPLLLWNGLFMCIGFYALIPYLSYYLTHKLGWTPFAVGLLLMVRQLSQQGLMLLTGMFADRLGYRPTIALGFVLRGIGFGLFAFVHSPFLLYVSAIVAGLGGSLFEPTSDAALSSLVDFEERSKVYSIKKVFDNLGMVLSAFVGALLMAFNFQGLSIVSGTLFISMGFVTAWRLPRIQVQIRKVAIREMFSVVVQDKVFLRFVLCNTGFFFMFMQLYLTLPIRIVEVTHKSSGVSLVNLILALILITCQVPITRLVSGHSPVRNLQIGLSLMAAGLLVMGATNTLAWFVVGLFCYAFGIIFVEPASFDVTTRLARRDMTATYFGFFYLAMAIGGGLSQGTGGYLLQLGQSKHVPLLLYLICAIVALTCSVGLIPLRRHLLPFMGTDRAPSSEPRL